MINAAINQLAVLCSRAGLSPNGATLLGFGMSFIAAYFIVSESFVLGAICIAVSGLFDVMDGRIARLKNAKTKFGALLDSSVDRMSDALYYFAIFYHYLMVNEWFYVFFTLSALVGSFQISYVRARSEGLSLSCQVGFWERGERTVLLIGGLVLGNLNMTILLLGVLTHLTAFERLLYSRDQLLREGEMSKETKSSVWQQLIWTRGSRLSGPYFFKASLIVLIMLVIRP